ncbi:hypothetical protein SODALDRAFT_157877 [Sodiomyces alkalinus F11]|uniref:Uncharacterized protein n=1 Tax=Sodiomyces alkalinus (strain CBS 110278 / VKM F-3762 / F11) TaxID=1314773 RepID=A0A3N2PXW2_SODAK|nr:hypothetical protein SODALDRAFT_157877 [Sodiomyces alkalinus F11]ROT39369.1 hypothetical protein SODALDRAFT_157877 [Sodiomyces alkalinus F11]
MMMAISDDCRHHCSAYFSNFAICSWLWKRHHQALTFGTPGFVPHPPTVVPYSIVIPGLRCPQAQLERMLEIMVD